MATINIKPTAVVVLHFRRLPVIIKSIHKMLLNDDRFILFIECRGIHYIILLIIMLHS